MNAPNNEQYTRYSVFSISGKLFGLELSTVREVIPPPKITSLPNVPTHIVGVYNLRGSIIALVDIQQILDLKLTEKKDTDMILLVEFSNFLVSFIVEQVLDFVEVENSKIQLPSTNIPTGLAYYVRGLYDANNMGQIILLETARLLDSNRLFIRDDG